MPMPQQRPSNIGYLSLNSQPGSQAATKHSKNTSEHYPVQINGRQMNVAHPHQPQLGLALKQ